MKVEKTTEILTEVDVCDAGDGVLGSREDNGCDQCCSGVLLV